MKIKLVGTISNGFKIQEIIRGNSFDGGTLAITRDALIEYIDVSKPLVNDNPDKVSELYDQNGDTFVCFSSGLENVTFYGPFNSYDEALGWVVEERAEDSEWHIYGYTPPAMLTKRAM